MKYLDRGLLYLPYLALCQSERVFKNELVRLKIKKDVEFVPKGKGGCCHFFDNEKDEVTIIVCIKHDPDITAPQVLSLITHEAVHVWQHVREDMSEDSPSSEFEAWSIQSITQKLLSAYKPKIIFNE